jgi:branched-chain amino acid transport system substrate-binding protein
MSEPKASSGNAAVSRREFMKMAGAAGLAIGLGGGLGGLVAGCGGEKTETTSAGQQTVTTAAQQAGAAGDVIRIGVMIGMSGWFSSYDMSGYEELATMADIINGDGGLPVAGKNYKIELVPQDIKSTLDGTTAAANKLAYDDKVKFVVGPNAFFNSACTPVFNEAKVMHVASYITCTPPEINKDTPYTFVGNNSLVGKSIGQTAVFRKLAPNAKTICDVSPDDGAIPYFYPIIKRAFEANGFQVVGEPIGFPNEIVDFAPIATKLVAANPDIGFQCNGAQNTSSAMIKNLREQGWFNPYGGNTSCGAEDLVKTAGKEYATNFLGIAMDPKDKGNPEFAQRVIDALLAKWGETRSIDFNHALSAYSLLQCMKNAGSLDVAELIKYWETTDGFDTLLGPGKVGGLETYGIRHAVGHPMQYSWIVDGQVAESGYHMEVVIP